MTQTTNDPVRTGGCQCGEIRYELRGEPVDLYVCHCSECRKQSSSAFGISLIVRAADFVLLSGAPKVWSRPAAVAGSIDCSFCPNCGSRFLHGNVETDETVSIKGGSLDRPLDLSNAKHIWTSSKLPGVAIPGHVETHAEEPPA
ncbi:MAG: GFA family protein [Alphaproteobacteria bacterium]